ncbi:tetratricopeptide repeat protein [Actinacidiphila sp. ITFR-21]|uniref:tetratricopeptide repeat protein n=1 Tax=Actinacidiphila sp. ITFR-21 TaxID=3075199 RepID=UPI00288B30CD|nr:tetratricopeptide repeat protein [Streptomyces sp. ITFR-21]WNI16564.1 tetratricopeptide repeat protein [Streptomyces sp. ITFR-21]
MFAHVLTGTGGVGKTQLAADHARATWQNGNLDVLLWVTANTRSAVVAGYAQAGVELCSADPTDPEQAARTFLAWLVPKAGARPCRWLIALDDVADPGDLNGLWPPSSPSGQTVVTTRRRDAALTGGGRRRVEVGLFTEAEAVTYLTTSLTAHGRHEHSDQLLGLARDLGLLPLALSQGAAYLVDSGEEVAAYRTLLAGRATALTDTAPDLLPDEQTLPLATAWSLSVDRADALRPAGLAGPMLRLAAVLDPNGIPEAVLTSQPALAHLTRHRAHAHARHARPPVGDPGPVSPRDAARALRALHRLSLVDHTPAVPHRAVRVHQLVQRATRGTLTPDQHSRLILTAAEALASVWPAVERDTALAQALRANAAALMRAAADDEILYRPVPHPMLLRMGISLGESGQFAAAHDHFERMATTARRQLGADHPATLTTRNHLAQWAGVSGAVASAIAALEQLLADRQRVQGPNHADTLTTRSHLAYWRWEAGDAAGAVTAIAELIADCERVLGPDHPDTLTARSHLVLWGGLMGDAAGAATAFAELLGDCVRVLGPDHPYTLAARQYLAQWRGAAGDPVGAADASEQVLADCERVLGPEHFYTLTARSHLAYWQGEAGDADRSATAFAELIADVERVLGPEYLYALGTRGYLAYWRRGTSHISGALERVCANHQRALGPSHPDTLTARKNRAALRGLVGDAAGAATAFAELAADCERVLGPDHPDTLTVRSHLACLARS